MKKKINIFCWLIIIVLAFILLSNHYYSPDEGMTLNAAWQMWHGKIMYQDFVEFVSPGSALLVFLFWKIFNTTSYFIPKILFIFMWLSSALSLYLIANKFKLKKYLIFFSIILWLFASRYYILINHNYSSSFIAIWLVYFLILSLEKKFNIYYFITGLFAGIVFLLLQTKGIFLLFIILLFYFIYLRKIKPILLASSGFICSIMWLLLIWDYKLLFNSLFILPFASQYLEHDVFSWLVLLIILFISGVSTIVAFKNRNKNFIILTAIQIVLYLSISNSIERSHFLINSSIFCLFVSLFLNYLFIKLKFNIYYQAYILFSIILVIAGLSLSFIPWNFKNNIYYRDLINKQPQSIFALADIQNAENIYAGPFLPNYYYEFKKNNPYSISIAYLCDEDCQSDLLAQIKINNPEYALLNYQSGQHLNYSTNTVIDLYFQRNYQYCFKYGKVSVYTRTVCPQ